ncbi:MAG: hypothetical protein A2W93_08315 [Bacteroidetes bacterium GWF2_43_63]|nr:MAG: hypothetical protein A2W94_04970 [Bacteroidetes bacterium GWE2_42_42]OFY55612.1 MAG: hypothetical protein A2W93_08315 [Bacteroidetes bacterium GWF2_43_63]HBG71632.1 hypothetical protein [Bacteroidales bacterium]HCB62165.1 hypothetical protein [Bacteroidales bacterium]HCY22393.1 hypothetical protein [Bacteroidales bacterium]
MKKLLLIISILFIVSSCKDDFSTGIHSTVFLGMGSCMPVFDESDRDYKRFDGRVYLVNKEAADSMGQPGFVLLKLNSTSLEIRNGRLSTELPAGTFVVMTEEYFVNEPANTVTITEGEVSQQDVKIWICTSY